MLENNNDILEFSLQKKKDWILYVTHPLRKANCQDLDILEKKKNGKGNIYIYITQI